MSDKKCEHTWLPTIYPTDSQIFGTTFDEEVYLESDFIIVRCEECGEEGYVIAHII